MVKSLSCPVPHASIPSATHATSSTDASPSYSLPARLQQAVVETPCKLRLVTLAALLARCAAQAPGGAKVVVFLSACDCVEFAHRLLEGTLGNLQGCGTLFKLHGLMTQVQWMPGWGTVNWDSCNDLGFWQ